MTQVQTYDQLLEQATGTQVQVTTPGGTQTWRVVEGHAMERSGIRLGMDTFRAAIESAQVTLGNRIEQGQVWSNREGVAGRHHWVVGAQRENGQWFVAMFYNQRYQGWDWKADMDASLNPITLVEEHLPMTSVTVGLSQLAMQMQAARAAGAGPLEVGDRVRMISSYTIEGRTEEPWTRIAQPGDTGVVDELLNQRDGTISVRWDNMRTQRVSRLDASNLVRITDHDEVQPTDPATVERLTSLGQALNLYIVEHTDIDESDKDDLRTIMEAHGIEAEVPTRDVDFTIEISGTSEMYATDLDWSPIQNSFDQYRNVSIDEVDGTVTVNWSLTIEASQSYQGDGDPCEDHDFINNDWVAQRLDNLNVEYEDFTIESRACSACP